MSILNNKDQRLVKPAILLCLLIMVGNQAVGSNQPLFSQNIAEAKTAAPKFGSFLTPQYAAQLMHGKIAFIEQRGQPNYQIADYDFDAQSHDKLFPVPANGRLHQISNSPDGQQIAVAYSIADTNQLTGKPTGLGRSKIYLIDLKDKNPTPQFIFADDDKNAFCYNPIWSADSRYLYFVSYKKNATYDDEMKIKRYDFQRATSDVLIDNAGWPSLSTDGKRLTYLSVNHHSKKRALWTANSDGSNPQQLVAEDVLYDLNLPLFSIDGQWIYFAVPQKPVLTWYQRLSPLSLAYAHGNHDVPSRWGRISTQGGNPEILNTAPSQIYFGQFSPDGRYLGYTSDKGFHIWDATTQHESLLLKSRAMRGFTWL